MREVLAAETKIEGAQLEFIIQMLHSGQSLEMEEKLASNSGSFVS